jgi:hypothetical protein
MDAKQFGWLYMIEHGQAGCKPSYYGGWDVVPEAVERYQPRKGFYSSIDMADLREKMLADVRLWGVDWDRTDAVQSDSVSEFTDTFHDPDTREILRGTLVLLNGTRQQWMADAVEVTNVFDMMAQLAGATTRFEAAFWSVTRS